MTRQQIEAVVRRWMGYWQGAPRDDFDQVHAPGFVDRSSNGRGTDRAAFRGGIEELYRGFPDFHATTDGIVVDEAVQQAAVRWTGRGTHRGEIMGRAPTGAVVDFAGIEIVRFEGDQIVERWGEMDGAQVMKQLEGKSAPAPREPPGAPSWLELGSPTGEKARSFYGGLFGWSFDDMGGDNYCATTPTLKVGIHPQDPDACIVVYFAVADIRAAAARVRQLGGQAGEPGDEQPGFGHFLECRDDQGVRFGLRQPPER